MKPNTNKPKSNNRKSAKQYGSRRPRVERGLGDGGRPSMRMEAHLMISQNVSGVALKQINITPALSSFP
jgi:hypothetical protein